jgi:DNA-binding NarL/FixJ family response regulator
MNPDPPAVRIVVADDHDVVRSGFASLLDTQPEFTVIGTARAGLEAVRVGWELQPDVVLMDIRMPGIDGIEATRQLTSQGPNKPRILIFTTFDLDEYVYDALPAGASGFLLKDTTAEQLFEAVSVIAAGDALLAPGDRDDAAVASPRPPGLRGGLHQPGEVSHDRRRADLEGQGLLARRQLSRLHDRRAALRRRQLGILGQTSARRRTRR